MSALLALIAALSLEVIPLACHRLITNPYPEQEWDSVIVSSDPITIREKTHNATTPLKPDRILRPRKRSYEECPENDFECLYGMEDKTKGSNQIVDKFLQQYAHVADVKYSGEEEKGNENSRKTYWTMVDSQTHNHPYDDKKGWVTLDPVPWSTSKISKWHPDKELHQESQPWDYAPTTQHPPQQFWVSGSSYHPQVPTSHWGIGTNGIITDNKPSDFPSAHPAPYGNGNHHPGNAVLQGNYNRQEIKGNHPSRYPQDAHPSTYPSHGNGEWILLSTTKGYSHPQRHRWPGQRNPASRKMKPLEISKYHEEDLKEKFVLDEETPSGNRKSDAGGAGEANATAHGTGEETPVQVLYTGAPKDEESFTTFRRKVRLQVLPSLETSSTSYGGLLEVDSSPQTVDEAQQEDEKMKKLKTIANVKRNKIRGFKLVPTSKVTAKGHHHNSMMTLAAVGAGMIPATMALLVPMALGRRKRSLPLGPPPRGGVSNGPKEW